MAKNTEPADDSAEESTQTSPLTVSTYDATAIRTGETDLPESLFGQTPNMGVMHQAYVRQLANARQGTAATKNRSLVRGGGSKPYRQKGTGRARHGSTREPSMVGGATVWGPNGRTYAQRMPRKMRRLALRSALSIKATEGRVRIVDGFALDGPKTKAMVELLRGLGIQADETVLVVLPAASDVVARSTNNLPWAKVILAHNLSLYDIFTHDQLVIAKDAIGLLEEILAS